MINMKDAQGELLETYRRMQARPLPPAYRPSHGDAPGIVRSHSLDPELMARAFGTSGSLHQGEQLAWADRELIAASASQTNQCFY
jgi:alkylhydroperoxidase family enzyme